MSGLPPVISRTARALSIAGNLLLLGGACGRSATIDTANDAAWPFGLAQTDVSRLEDWLFCDVCENREREKAESVGTAAIGPLDRLLGSIPQAWTDTLRLRYGRSASRARPRASEADSTSFVNRHVANFVAMVQTRAAFTLSDLRTPEATEALRRAADSAVTRGYRPDVIRAVEEALRSATMLPFSGTIRPNAVGFLDTVWVVRGTQVWDGDESAVLHGAPFPDDILVGREQDSFAVVAAGETGQYALTIRNIGTSQDSQFALLRIKTFPGLPVTSVRDITAGPFPLTILGALSRLGTPADLVHYYRIQPSAAIRVAAEASWHGQAQVDVIWSDCKTHVPGTGIPRRVSGAVFDLVGNSLGGVRVSAEGIVGDVQTPPSGQFSMIVPPGWRGTLTARQISSQPVVVPAWEGLSNLRIIIGDAGAFAGQLHQAQSPSRSSLDIPAGECRYLGLVKTDTLQRTTIVRLLVSSP
jgi:hypothetical protein